MLNNPNPLGEKPTQNIVQSALAAGRESAPKVISNPIQDGVPFVVLRDDKGQEIIEHLYDRFENPVRKIASVKMSDAESFARYWQLHTQDGSNVYGQFEPAQFLAVFDDHELDLPCYRQHRCLFELAHSLEYETWTEKNRVAFNSNEAFAIWIEDQLPDIINPSGAAMLEMALNFRVTQNAAFGSAIRLDDGNTALNFTSEVEGSSKANAGTVKIPSEFQISIPVYSGLEARRYTFTARFRYRLQGAKLSIWYELIRPHKVVEQAFSDLLAFITEKCGKPVLFGSPE